MIDYILVFVAVMVIIIQGLIQLFNMARVNTDHTSAYLQVERTANLETDDALPHVGLTVATRLTKLYLVETDPADATRVRLASNQSTTVRGILCTDQEVLVKTLTLDETTPLKIVSGGLARCYSNIAARSVRLVSAGAGLARPYTPAALGGTDTENMIIGRADCGVTANGDIIDINLNLARHGTV